MTDAEESLIDDLLTEDPPTSSSTPTFIGAQTWAALLAMRDEVAKLRARIEMMAEQSWKERP